MIWERTQQRGYGLGHAKMGSSVRQGTGRRQREKRKQQIKERGRRGFGMSQERISRQMSRTV